MDIYCVIPASDSNRYSQHGDLETWGDTTLLEWKLSQLREVKVIKRIYISTSSEKIAQVAAPYGVEIISRASDLTLPEIYRSIADAVGENHLLLTNPTAPFLGPRVLADIVDKFLKADFVADGMVTVRKQQEYLLDRNGPFNFPSEKEAFSRRDLDPLYIVTNGAYLIPAKAIRSNGRLFGKKPIMYEVNWLESLEIRDIEQMTLFSSLLNKYFEREF